MKIKESGILWIAIGFNAFVLLLMVLYSMSIFDEAIVWDTLRLIWFLSFGWICGRFSR